MNGVENSVNAAEDTNLQPGRTPVELRRDVVLMCAETGAVISLTSTDERRPRWVRAVLFLASGETFWFAPPATRHWKQGFELVRSDSFGEQRLRFTGRGSPLPEPAEVVDGAASLAEFRVPLTLELVLEPLCKAVSLDDPTVPPAATMVAQPFRATGSLAVGSLVYRLRGQAWSSRSGFSAANHEQGVRIQAAFQDGSSLLACEGSSSLASDRTATHQIYNQISAHRVHRLEVDGPERDVASRLSCTVGNRSGFEIVGTPRHVEGYQHVAFLSSRRGTSEWVRVGYTPFDFVRSGVTGFGLLEQVSRVPTAERAAAESPELPDPWD